MKYIPPNNNNNINLSSLDKLAEILINQFGVLILPGKMFPGLFNIFVKVSK